MSMDRPAFPGSLPPKPSGQFTRPMSSVQIPRPAFAQPSSNTGSESLGTIRIVLWFLIVATLSNIGLTLYMTRPKDIVNDTPAETKASEAMREITQLRDDLTRARTSLATSASEIGRLKTEYAAVIARLGAITTPSTPAHSSVSAPPAAPEAATARTEGAPK